MIIFLYGKNTYLSREKLKEIIEHYKTIHKTGMNLKIYDQDIEFDELRDMFFQVSMFKEKKLVVLKSVFNNKKFKEDFLKNKKLFKDIDDVLVFFEEDKVLKSDRLSKFLRDNGKTQEFNLLDGIELKNWIIKEFENNGLYIDTRVVNKIIDSVGNDMWQLSNEINKLSNYAKKIELKDIDTLIKPKIETEIFKTINALAQRDKKKALTLIEKHLENGDSPFYLLSMISFQFRNLLILKTGNNAGIHPFVVKKTLPLLSLFTFEELKKIYHYIFQIDLEMKTGKIDPEEAIRSLISCL